MDKNWGRSIRLVLEADKGLAGLTLAEHNAFREHHADPPLKDVKDAQKHEIETIYRLSYWMPYVPALPSGLDYFLFDTAVCVGVPEAIKDMQRALQVDPDGHLGVVTTQAIVRAVRAKALPALLDAYAAQRRDLVNKNRIQFALEQAKVMVEH